MVARNIFIIAAFVLVKTIISGRYAVVFQRYSQRVTRSALNNQIHRLRVAARRRR